MAVARMLGDKPSKVSIEYDPFAFARGERKACKLTIDGVEVEGATGIWIGTIEMYGRSSLSIAVNRSHRHEDGTVWTTSDQYTVTGPLTMEAGVHLG